MRNLKLVLMIAFVALSTVAFGATKSEKKTVVLNVTMDCGSCAKKIQEHLRFEKGVQKVTCDVKKQEVEITYKSDKTTEEKLLKSVSDLGYKSSIKKPVCKTECTKAEKKKSSCCGNHEPNL